MVEIREPRYKIGEKLYCKQYKSSATITGIADYSFNKDKYFYTVEWDDGDYLDEISEDLLEQYVENNKTVWDLEKGDTFYVIDSDGDVMKGTWVGNRFENNCRKREIGNIFLTKEEALFEAERRKVEAEMLQLGGRRKMKRDDDNYYISYDEKTGNLAYLMRIWVNVQGLIFFDSAIDAIDAVQEIGEDRIKKYIFGVE